MTDIADDYAAKIEGAILPFLRSPISRQTVSMLTDVARRAQANFLYEHPEYVALRPLQVHETDVGTYNIDAPIGTHAEKLELEHWEKERQRVAEELLAEAEADRERQRKSEHNMERLHRRLMRRCAERISPSTRAIWDSLSIGQQYAILKDIDYEMRHGVRVRE